MKIYIKKSLFHLYGEDNRMVVIPFLRHLRVKPYVRLSHEAGLQHIATAAVLTKKSIVHIHPLPCCLEV